MRRNTGVALRQADATRRVCQTARCCQTPSASNGSREALVKSPKRNSCQNSSEGIAPGCQVKRGTTGSHKHSVDDPRPIRQSRPRGQPPKMPRRPLHTEPPFQVGVRRRSSASPFILQSPLPELSNFGSLPAKPGVYPKRITQMTNSQDLRLRRFSCSYISTQLALLSREEIHVRIHEIDH